MNKAILSDKLENIYKAYPELNMDWVVTGVGEMLRKDYLATEVTSDGYPLVYDEINNILRDPSLSESIEHLKQQIKMKDEIIELQRKLLSEKTKAAKPKTKIKKSE